MTQLVVGVADGLVSQDSGSVLVTYALGSCIGLALHDGSTGVAGLLHFMLPTSTIDPEKGRQNPWMFADTGVPKLLEQVLRLGAERRRLVVRAVGGAQVMDPAGVFAIGKRNYLELKKVLWKVGLMLDGELVGGTVSRTVRLEVASGRLWVREAGSPERELTSKHAARASAPVQAAATGGEQWRTGS